MLSFVVRKLLNNPWMSLCLLLGSILVVAMMAGVPVYSEGILQRMLVRDLELHQEMSGLFPGRFNLKVEHFLADEGQSDEALEPYHFLEEAMSVQRIGRIVRLPILRHSRELALDFLEAEPSIRREEDPPRRMVQLEAIEGITEHLEITHGRTFGTTIRDGVIEAVVTKQAMRELDLLLDEVYAVSSFIDEITLPFRVKVVGVADIPASRDPFWYKHPSELKASFLMDIGLFEELFLENDLPAHLRTAWDFAFDYHEITLDTAKRIITAYADQKQSMRGFSMPYLRVPAIRILEQYQGRERRLKLTLWILQVPLLLMLLFFIFMVSHLAVKHERDEIAVLKSRGFSSARIFVGYLLESLLLSLAALLFGPPLGLLLCRIIGLSSGFLEFVRRTSLPLKLNVRAFTFSLFASALFMATMLVPAYLASRTTIVIHKRRKSARRTRPIAKMMILDAVLLGISGYGLYRFQTRQRMLELTGISGTDLLVDPLLYVISTLFIVAAGLLFLLAYTYVIRFLSRVGRRAWPPVVYSSLIQVGRAGSFEQFPMLFLILTLALGVYDARAARTLNTNIEEKIFYSQGADITLMAQWESNAPPDLGIPGYPEATVESSEAPIFEEEPIIYVEPPFQPFTELTNVEAVTKVLRRERLSVQLPEATARNVSLLAVIPHEFGRVAWFRADLLPHHWYMYLNVLARNPQAVLLSSSLQEEYELELGQSIWFSWESQRYLEGIVCGFVDYWPSFNPMPGPGLTSKPRLLVANLSYIHAKMTLEPYEVWLKKKEGSPSAAIYAEIEAADISVESLQDADQEIIRKRNDPMLQGTNGALTLSFLITLGISFVGFLIYWVITVRERVLQFGVCRAIGMRKAQILGILACEHALVSVIPILAGITIGGIAAQLFVPLLQLTADIAEQVPPFKVVARAGDYAKIYAVVLFMLAAAFSALGIIASKIRIHQAVKLGEE